MSTTLRIKPWRPDAPPALYADARAMDARSIIDALSEHRLQYLVCTVDGGDVAFLDQAPPLKGIRLFVFSSPDISAIGRHLSLEHVAIWGEDCRSDVDFSGLNELLTADFNGWSEHYSSILTSMNLTRLTIGSYPHKKLDAFSRLRNLVHLCLWDGSPATNLEGLRDCPALRSLDLRRMTKLKSLDGIEDIPLTELSVDRTDKDVDVTAVYGLCTLERLTLANCHDIPTIRFLDQMSSLEMFLFHENTNVLDGDLAPIVRHAKLRIVGFQNRKHYTHKCSQIWQCHSPKYTDEEILAMHELLNS